MSAATAEVDNAASGAQEMQAVAIRRELMATLGPMPFWQKGVVAVLSAIVLLGLIAYSFQLRRGLSVTAMTNYFSWGVYIINFVFFIGISMAGTLISAVLRMMGANWRRPITRMAEGVTVIALLLASAMIVADMGRPDRFLYVFRYGRLQSPILWDVISLTSYLAGSALFLYLPLIPDLAILRDHGQHFSRWRRFLYDKLSLGWRGTQQQHRRLELSVSIMSVIIIPVAISIHTVTAWLFGMTLRPGWHSTIIGPDFVVGALYSGIAAVLTVMALFRWMFRLENYVTLEHFKKLSLLLLVLCAAYSYFMINEYWGPGYMMETHEQRLLATVFTGAYAVEFWSMVVIGLVIPGIMLALPWTRTLPGIIIAALLVNIGMWVKRYIIVVPTLSSPYMPLPESAGQHLTYVPTWIEWSITAAAFAASCLIYIIFSKIFPIVSIWEVSETLDTEPVDAGIATATEASVCAT